MTNPISAIWPKSEPLLLGNLLTFRKELELLAALRKTNTALLFFENPLEQIRKQTPYLDEALKSSLSIQLSSSTPEHTDWPPLDAPMNQWSYGSLKRISLLAQISSTFPSLAWPTSTEEEVNSLYLHLQKGHSSVIALHLKRQKGDAEESNADLDQWFAFLQKHPEEKFLLLGNDEIPESFFKLPNVSSAKALRLSLSIQLALCSRVDGFMGMASGICSAAIFSHTPYIIFKHPKHHPEEMEFELGTANRFTFSKPMQQLWREVDTLKNLTLALTNLKGELV